MGNSVPIIRTVTLNPAVDEAIAVEQLVLGSVNRCELDAVDPGGKGINAGRVIHRLGRPTLLLGFVAGVTGAYLRAALDREGVPHAFESVAGLTRINVMMLERANGRRTRMYLPGARVTAPQLRRLRDSLDDAPSGSIVVLGGSLPPGAPETFYAETIARLRERGVRCILDTSGTALEHALPARPLLVKPSLDEAEQVLGRSLPDTEAVIEAAHELQRRGAETVVISRGEASTIALGPDGLWEARPPEVAACSTVGSGDSMVAGLAIALNEGMPFPEALRLGSAAGAATAMTTGTHLGDAREIERLRELVIISQRAS
ncbi:MAG: 1-phosphofructokinase [Candidatus Baltobacteraceae bacterium]